MDTTDSHVLLYKYSASAEFVSSSPNKMIPIISYTVYCYGFRSRA